MNDNNKLNKVIVQLKRLEKHYEHSVKTYDDASLLDLSHTLRIWTELKKPLADILPDFSKSNSFRTSSPPKKLIKAAEGCQHVLSFTPGEVVTYASKGVLMSKPESIPDDQDFVSFVMFRPGRNNKAELGDYCFIAKNLNIGNQPELRESIFNAKTKRVNYIRWLGSEVVRLCFLHNGVLRKETITREMIINRVANTLDGSHSSVADDGRKENRFDAPIHHLQGYKAGGLPLHYFILLKIAQDIIEVASKYIKKQ